MFLKLYISKFFSDVFYLESPKINHEGSEQNPDEEEGDIKEDEPIVDEKKSSGSSDKDRDD